MVSVNNGKNEEEKVFNVIHNKKCDNSIDDNDDVNDIKLKLNS